MASQAGRGAQVILDGDAQAAARGVLASSVEGNRDAKRAMELAGIVSDGSTVDGSTQAGLPAEDSLLGPASLAFEHARVVSPPAGFPWPWSTYPVAVYGSQSRFSTNVNARSLVNAGIWSSSTFIHVDVVAGVDATAAVVSDPGDTSKAAKSIAKAVQLGNAAGVPYRILVKAGNYPRAYMLHSSAGNVNPTQPCSVEAWGGRAVMHTTDETLTYAVDATYTNTYSTSRTNVLRVMDLLNRDANGFYAELTNVATPALCNTTPGSWTQNGSLLNVRRADGAAVTATNTRAYLGGSLNPILLPANGPDFYMSGFDLEGGASGCVSVVNSGTPRNLVFADCTFRYAGSVASPIDGVQIAHQTGIAAFFRCDASANSKDGFNFHRTFGTGPFYALTVDCTGKDNGRGTSTSNNGWTSHEDVIGIDVNGVYSANRGGNVHAINNTRTWCVGTLSENSLGDVAAGGVMPSTGFVVGQSEGAGNSAVMWLDGTLARGNIRAVWAHNVGGAIYTRGHRSSGGAETADSGAILTTY